MYIVRVNLRGLKVKGQFSSLNLKKNELAST